MKKLFYLIYALLAFAGFTLMVSCEEEEPEPLPAETAEFSVADYALWYYFSFETGDVVGTGASDPTAGDDEAWKVRTDWDMAFHRQDVRSNSGTSGNGQGGIFKAFSSVLADITEAPTSGYEVDDSVSIIPAFAMPPTYVNTPASVVASKWANYDHDEGWSIVDQAFVVKTADGKYAKIKLVNFLNENDESGYITMEYMYQPDGSTKLE